MAKRDISFLVNDIKEATVEAARNAAVDIMNSLAEKGPVWTGRFSSAWYAVPSDASVGGARSEGKIHKYDLRNVPAARFTAGTLYKIVNGMSYADQAQDFVEFDPPEQRLTKGTIAPDRLIRGERPEGGRRGELNSGRQNNRSTAPLDWYLTYVNGGGLKQDLGAGTRRGFGTYKPRGFGR
ncbi:MAG: hypothetical protein ACO3S3_11495 [Pseudohongiellaceae bacterium]